MADFEDENFFEEEYNADVWFSLTCIFSNIMNI